MRARGRVAIDRDQEASPFSAILKWLCEGCSAHAAALVDKEGETVDYAGRISPYEIRVAAAELRSVLAFTRTAEVPGFCDVNEIRIRKSSFAANAIVGLGDGYAIVIELARHSLSLSRRPCAGDAELEFEAGIASVLQPGTTRWSRARSEVVQGRPATP